MPSPFISGDSLDYCARLEFHCFRLLVGVVDWCARVGKADLLSDRFDSKQFRESVDLRLSCQPSPSLITFAFRSNEVWRLLLDMDSYGGIDPFGFFSLFHKTTSGVLATRLSVVFRRFVCLGSFLACWRQANVTPIPKGPPSSSVANYGPIYITLVLSKVFEHLVSVRLCEFIEHSSVLPTIQFYLSERSG